VNGPRINWAGGWIPNDDSLEWVSPEEAGWSSAELQEAHPFAIQSECQASNGAFFYNNNWDINALGTIFEQETGSVTFFRAPNLRTSF